MLATQIERPETAITGHWRFTQLHCKILRRDTTHKRVTSREHMEGKNALGNCEWPTKLLGRDFSMSNPDIPLPQKMPHFKLNFFPGSNSTKP